MNDSKILITGGSGSLGNALIEEINKTYTPRKVIIYSRDECKHFHMQKKYDIPWLRFLIGDVRDKQRLIEVLEGIDYVIHAAAMKQIGISEYNPLEAVKTNINGSANVIEACNHHKVKRCVFISTDKACQPINLYGATKFTAEKLFLAANSYNRTQFRVIRYGNILASRGSVVETFLELKKNGIHEFPITDVDMTRFWWTLPQAANAVICILTSPTKDMTIPLLKAMKITDLARVIDSECTFKVIGIRQGEKLHEALTPDYTSDSCPRLTPNDIKKMLNL